MLETATATGPVGGGVGWKVAALDRPVEGVQIDGNLCAGNGFCYAARGYPRAVLAM
jgi:hypothetical protein